MLIIPFPLRRSQAITGNHRLSDAIRCSSSHYHSGNHMQSDALRCDHAQRGSAQSDEGCLRIPRKGWYKLEYLTIILAKALLLKPGPSGAIGGHRGSNRGPSGAIRNSQVASNAAASTGHQRPSDGHQMQSTVISCNHLARTAAASILTRGESVRSSLMSDLKGWACAMD